LNSILSDYILASKYYQIVCHYVMSAKLDEFAAK